jgi:hypothetical protein
MSYAFEYEYEQPEQDDVSVAVELEIEWEEGDPDVGVFGATPECTDFSFTINGRKVPWNMVSKQWVLDSFAEILDRAAFMSDLSQRLDRYMEGAEPPDYEPPERDYDED